MGFGGTKKSIIANPFIIAIPYDYVKELDLQVFLFHFPFAQGIRHQTKWATVGCQGVYYCCAVYYYILFSAPKGISLPGLIFFYKNYIMGQLFFFVNSGEYTVFFQLGKDTTFYLL